MCAELESRFWPISCLKQCLCWQILPVITGIAATWPALGASWLVNVANPVTWHSDPWHLPPLSSAGSLPLISFFIYQPLSPHGHEWALIRKPNTGLRVVALQWHWLRRFEPLPQVTWQSAKSQGVISNVPRAADHFTRTSLELIPAAVWTWPSRWGRGNRRQCCSGCGSVANCPVYIADLNKSLEGKAGVNTCKWSVHNK